MSVDRQLQVFLCHAKEDKDRIRDLYKWLESRGYLPWLDEVSIPAGKNWLLEIQKAIRESHVILVCLSLNSVRKRGVVQREIRLALDAATERPEDEIYVIPCRLEECDIPIGLKHWQWVDLFDAGGHEKLENSLGLCVAAHSTIQCNTSKVSERTEEIYAGEGSDVGAAMDFIMHCAGTSARNTVNSILDGHKTRKGRLEPTQLVEWLLGKVEEAVENLSSVDAPDGDDFIATRLKGAVMGANFASSSFKKALTKINEFCELESNLNDREEYIVSRLENILVEWIDYDIDEWAANNEDAV